MNAIKQKEQLKFARLLDQEHQLTLKIRALKDKQGLNGGRFTCIEYSDNGLVLSVTLSEFMALFPETEQGTWHTYSCDDGSVKGYHRYGPSHVGELRKGYNLWVKHETKSVVVKEADKPVEAAA